MLCDRDDVLDALALAKDHFGESLAQGAVMVEPRKSQVLVGQVLERGGSILDGALARPHLKQDLTKVIGVHRARSRSTIISSFRRPLR
jgi:hypothetical protein